VKPVGMGRLLQPTLSSAHNPMMLASFMGASARR
jgi:hypothetical protein